MNTLAAAVTLPVTGARVPASAAALTVKPTGSMQTSCGEAFTALVSEGKTVLGTIENEGRGGGTWLRPASAAGRARFDAIVAEHAALNPEDAFVGHEDLCNDLYEEVGLARELNRKRNAVAMLDGDRAQILIFKTPMDDRLRAHIANRYADRAPMVWIKKSGWATA